MSTETQKNVTIVLDENPTTGYTWAYTIDNPQVLQYTSDSYAQNPAASGLVGVGGQHTYVFSAVGPGTAIITFSLGQQWSGGTKDAQIAKYQVVVGQDGNISSQKKTPVTILFFLVFRKCRSMSGIFSVKNIFGG